MNFVCCSIRSMLLYCPFTNEFRMIRFFLYFQIVTRISFLSNIQKKQKKILLYTRPHTLLYEYTRVYINAICVILKSHSFCNGTQTLCESYDNVLSVVCAVALQQYYRCMTNRKQQKFMCANVCEYYV